MGDEIDSATAASMILATTRGLADALSIERARPDSVDEVLRPVIALVFTGRCLHYDRRGIPLSRSGFRGDSAGGRAKNR